MQLGFKIIFFLGALFFVSITRAQNNQRQILLDSLNQARANDKGDFNLYIKKPEFEIIVGVFRNRESSTQGFEPFNFTYHVYLPFQYDLNYVNLKTKDKLLKVNTLFIVHHSKYGNYAIGAGERFSFLLVRKLYLSYQIGIVWCEPVKHNTNDGINDMGFNLHHEYGLGYNLNKQLKLSLNVIHLSNGNLFQDVDNNQDVIGFGLAYGF